MRFGIYSEIQTPPGKSHYEMIWEIMRQIEHADQSGFDVYSVIDHHFFQKFSISANPLAMFAAAAQRNERIRFLNALHTLPLDNPMCLAGMIAEADILTNGRLECGLGRGHAWLFGPSALPLEESRPRHNEAIDILELAFAKERFSYDGHYYKVKDVSVVPRPLQQPHPKVLHRRHQRPYLSDGRRERMGHLCPAAAALESAGRSAQHLQKSLCRARA
jgi:alkanesulfonate monooxygenase SsuD/methylene tetrahydromethanopterin reductase-like flavin-dependent oxidoreductase (luciferase family)